MSSRKRRILCAETNEDVCALLVRLFEWEGHEVFTARSIGECLRLAEVMGFDLYMVDDRYIDGTSLDLCRELRRLTPETPILFFSTQALERDRARAIAAGADAYLIKPDDVLEVVSVVNSVLLPRQAQR